MANKHDCKEVNTILSGLQRMNFRVEIGGCRSGGTIKIYPPDKSQQMYVTHAGEGGLHPLRRWIRRSHASVAQQLNINSN